MSLCGVLPSLAVNQIEGKMVCQEALPTFMAKFSGRILHKLWMALQARLRLPPEVTISELAVLGRQGRG